MADIDAMAMRVWPKHPLTTEDQVNHNQQAWKRAVAYLGSKWLVVKKVPKRRRTDHGD